MIHSFGNRFSAVNVFTSRPNGAVSLQARNRMNASVLPFSFDLLESTMKFYYPANTAIVIESDVFHTLEFKSTDRASALLQKAASYNVSLFCITSQLSSIPWRLERRIGILALARGYCITEDSDLYRYWFAPLFANFGEFSAVFKHTTKKKGSCLISHAQREVRFMPGSDTIPDWMSNTSPSTQSPTPSSSASTVASTTTTLAENDIAVPETAAEPSSGDDEHVVSSIDFENVVLPTYMLLAGPGRSRATSLMIRTVAALRSRFKFITVFTSLAVGDEVKKLADTFCTLCIANLRYTFDRCRDSQTAVIVESDIFDGVGAKSDEFRSLLRNAKHANVSVFCVTSSLSGMPSFPTMTFDMVGAGCDLPACVRASLYDSFFFERLATYERFNRVLDLTTQSEDSCLVWIKGRNTLGFIPGVEQVDGKVRDEKSSSPSTQVVPPPSSSAASSATVDAAPTKTDVATSKAASEWTASIDQAITNLAVFETSDNARAKELAARIVVVLRAARNTPPTAATALGTVLGVVGAIFVWYAEVKAASAAKV